MKGRILVFPLLFFLLYIVLSFATNSEAITITLNVTKYWWNDSVSINGTALYSNGDPISDGSVSVELNNKIYCTTNTTPSGNYNCSFTAPLELGTYDVLVNVTSSTGSMFTNTTSMKVQVKYGKTPIGTTDRIVYEQPMLIQEPSGRIRIVWVRIMVWGG